MVNGAVSRLRKGTHMKLFKNPDIKTPMSLRSNTLRIDWYDADEGLNGDYDPDNPDDIHLLRFDVYAKKPNSRIWTAVEDASYCTNMPIDTDPAILERALRYLFKEYEDAMKSGGSVKKLGEGLSWIGPEDFPAQTAR